MVYSHWTETKNKVWVKLDLEAGVPKKVWVKKGGTTARDGDATFLFFDDFSGTSLDGTKWNTDGTVTTAVSGGILTLSSASWGIIYTSQTFPVSVIVESKAKLWLTGKGLSGVGLAENHDLSTSPHIIIGARDDNSGWWHRVRDTTNHWIYTGTDNSGVFQVFRFDRKSSSTDFYRDDDLKQTIAYAPSANAIPLTVQCSKLRNDAYAEYDYIFVRKYTETPPLVSEPEIIDANTLKYTITSSETVTDYQIALDISDLALSTVDDNIYVEDYVPQYETVTSTMVNNNISAQLDEFVATEGQTVFTCSEYIIEEVNVFVNGTPVTNYTLDKINKTVTFDSGLTLNDTVQIMYFKGYMEPLANENINIYDLSGTLLETVTTDDKGQYTVQIERGMVHYVQADTEGNDSKYELYFPRV